MMSSWDVIQINIADVTYTTLMPVYSLSCTVSGTRLVYWCLFHVMTEVMNINTSVCKWWRKCHLSSKKFWSVVTAYLAWYLFNIQCNMIQKCHFYTVTNLRRFLSVFQVNWTDELKVMIAMLADCCRRMGAIVSPHFLNDPVFMRIL